MELWHQWKTTFERVYSRITKDMMSETGLSDGDFIILSHISSQNNNLLRQQELADLMEWSKSRLSHHLSRMEKRELIARTVTSDGGTYLSGTELGFQLLEQALPIREKAINDYFLALLNDKDKEFIRHLYTQTSQLSE